MGVERGKRNSWFDLFHSRLGKTGFPKGSFFLTVQKGEVAVASCMVNT